MTQSKFEKEFKRILNIDKNFCILTTKLGNLHIHCLDGWIAMRFLNDDFSVSKFFAEFSEHEPLNRYSYKWNIHCTEMEDCLQELQDRLEILL